VRQSRGLGRRELGCGCGWGNRSARPRSSSRGVAGGTLAPAPRKLAAGSNRPAGLRAVAARSRFRRPGQFTRLSDRGSAVGGPAKRTARSESLRPAARVERTTTFPPFRGDRRRPNQHRVDTAAETSPAASRSGRSSRAAPAAPATATTRGNLVGRPDRRPDRPRRAAPWFSRSATRSPTAYKPVGPRGSAGPDVLADRLDEVPGTAPVAVANAGISGNTVRSAQTRTTRPGAVLRAGRRPQRLGTRERAGRGRAVRKVILLGGHQRNRRRQTSHRRRPAARSWAAMTGIAGRGAHARGLRTSGATVLAKCMPPEETASLRPRAGRQRLIRTSGTFDGVGRLDSVPQGPGRGPDRDGRQTWRRRCYHRTPPVTRCFGFGDPARTSRRLTTLTTADRSGPGGGAGVSPGVRRGPAPACSHSQSWRTCGGWGQAGRSGPGVVGEAGARRRPVAAGRPGQLQRLDPPVGRVGVPAQRASALEACQTSRSGWGRVRADPGRPVPASARTPPADRLISNLRLGRAQARNSAAQGGVSTGLLPARGHPVKQVRWGALHVLQLAATRSASGARPRRQPTQASGCPLYGGQLPLW